MGANGSLEMPRQRERMDVGGGGLALLSNETRSFSGLLRQTSVPAPSLLCGRLPLLLLCERLTGPVPVSKECWKSSYPAPAPGEMRARLTAGPRPVNSLGVIIMLKGVTSQAAEPTDGLRPPWLQLLPLFCMGGSG